MHYEIYKIKGRKYKYAVNNYREGKKVRHKKTYIGALEPINKTKRKRGGGRKPVIFIRQITSEEKTVLDKAGKSQQAFTRDRARIILFSSQNLKVNEIANKLSCEIRKVREAIKSFNKKGLLALIKGKAKGAKIKFSDVCKKIILLHFSKHPNEFGLHFTTWTLPRFTKHLIDYKVVESISIETVRQILDEAGAKLKKSKRWQYSPDKEFEKKNKQ
jgi:transposase